MKCSWCGFDLIYDLTGVCANCQHYPHPYLIAGKV